MDRKIVIVTALLIAFPAGIGTVLAQTNGEDTDTGAQATGADLIPEDLAHAPHAPTPGENVTFTANVTNQGTNATGPFNVTFLLDGTQHGPNQTVDGLDAGNTTQLTTEPWNATEGNHTFTVVVDAHDDVDETDEANNEAELTFTVEAEADEEPDPPNLVASDLSADPSDPAPGDDTTFSANVSNDGESDAKNVTVRFLVDGTPLGENVTIGTLGTGNTTAVTSEVWNASDGNHTIEVVVDPDETVDETSEDDNTDTLELTVQADEEPEPPAPANLVAEDLSADPAEPSGGENVTFEATVGNDGEADANNVTVRFLVDGTQLGDDTTIETLSAGNDTLITSDTWNATDGNHTIEVVVDPDDTVDETSETDNTDTLELTVQADEDPDEGDDGDEGDEDERDGENTMTICHVPPGNPDARHTIEIGEPAWDAHERHGDHEGACENAGENTSDEADEGDHTAAEDHEDGNQTASEDGGNQTATRDDGSGNATAAEDEGDEAERQEQDRRRRGPPDHARARGR